MKSDQRNFVRDKLSNEIMTAKRAVELADVAIDQTMLKLEEYRRARDTARANLLALELACDAAIAAIKEEAEAAIPTGVVVSGHLRG